MSAPKQDGLKHHTNTLRLGEIAGLLSALFNLCFALTKGIFARLCGSACLFADALNNLTDALGGVLSYLGFHLSGRAANARFPLGFSRAQGLCAFSLGLWMIAAGMTGFLDAATALFDPASAREKELSLALLFGFAGAKAMLGTAQIFLARRCSSHVLTLCAKDSFIDSISGLFVVLSAILQQNGTQADAWFGAFFSAALIVSGALGAYRELPGLIGGDRLPIKEKKEQ